jgi:hypothetical protein
LTNKVVEASRADAELYALAKAQAAAHNRMLALAADVRALQPEAIAGVLKANGAAGALKDVVEGFRLFAEGKSRLIGQIDLWEYDALPDEAATSSGYTPIADADRNQLQFDNACAVALRAAVELLQVAPTDAVEVVARRCRAGGLTDADMDTVLYVNVSAAALAKLQLKKLEAAPTVVALGAQVDWSSARGLAPIRIDDPCILRMTAPRIAAA